jgi:hypothetical protein
MLVAMKSPLRRRTYSYVSIQLPQSALNVMSCVSSRSSARVTRSMSVRAASVSSASKLGRITRFCTVKSIRPYATNTPHSTSTTLV